MGKTKPAKGQRKAGTVRDVDPKGANPRRADFEKFYREGGQDFKPGNAYRSMLAAGYSETTAKSNCHILARAARVKVAEALESLGCDGFARAQKLLSLMGAETVRWNPKKKCWDNFADGELQLRTLQEINALFDEYPAPKEKVEDSRPITIVLPPSLSGMKASPAPSEESGKKQETVGIRAAR